MEVLRDGENPESLNKEELFFAGPDILIWSDAKKMRMVFPHISVVLKPLQLPYRVIFVFGFGREYEPSLILGRGGGVYGACGWVSEHHNTHICVITPNGSLPQQLNRDVLSPRMAPRHNN